ncbi:MAG: hypothetical protein ACI81Q_000128 [Paracoccaceae bacterium]|jgi:uncharacterized protein YdcH (DUF465 family)
MTHTPHELASEFLDQLDKISDLKQSDGHFSRLVEEYHEVNRTIHRAETRVEPMDDLRETELRKKRVHLKDEIAQALANA